MKKNVVIKPKDKRAIPTNVRAIFITGSANFLHEEGRRYYVVK